MKKTLLLVLAGMFLALPSYADPTLRMFSDNLDHFEAQVKFGTSTEDSRAIPRGGLCSVSVVHGGSGTVQLWQVPTSATAATSGTQVGSDFTSSTTNPTTFSPGLPYLKAVASVASDGTVMTVRCTNMQVSSSGGSGNVDADGDGLFEFYNADTDTDGDGTTWKRCNCGGTTTPGFTEGYICGNYRLSATVDTQTDYSGDDGANNPAECRFEGERVWDDITDDMAALEDKLAPGATVYFPPGIYPMKGYESGDNDGCWNSAAGDWSDVCRTDPVNSSYFLSGIRLRKDGQVFIGAGADGNGEKDLVRSGAWMVGVKGLRNTWTAANGGTVVTGTFSIGFPQDSSSGLGTSIFEDTSSGNVLLNLQSAGCLDRNDDGGPPQIDGVADGLCDYDGATSALESDLDARNVLCIDDTSSFVTTDIAPGDLVGITVRAASGVNTRFFLRVQSEGADCGADGPDPGGDPDGILVTFGGSTLVDDLGYADPTPHNIPIQVFGSQSASTDEAEKYAIVYGPLSEDLIVSNATVEGFTFAHQNYHGDGNCTDGSQPACDEGALVSPGSGRNNRFVGNALVHSNSANGSGGTIDVGGWNLGMTVEENVFRYNGGAALIDISTGGIFSNNIVEDNVTHKLNQAVGLDSDNTAMILNQGGMIRIAGNIFQRNHVGVGLKTSGIVKLQGQMIYVTGNTFTQSDGHCVVVDKGSQFIFVTDNIFQCGDALNADAGGNSTSNIWIPLTSDTDIESTQHVVISRNHFLAGGFHTTGDDESVKLIIGSDNDTNAGGIGPGGIQITDNMAVSDTAGSAFVGFRADDDPDSQRVYISGNSITQGGIAKQIGWFFGNLVDMNGAGTDVGLPVCGPNLIGGTVRAGDAASPANECSSAWTIP